MVSEENARTSIKKNVSSEDGRGVRLSIKCLCCEIGAINDEMT